MNELFTIGYSPHTLDSFLRILVKYQITAVADVRSSPYSQFKPEFNKDSFSNFLKNQKIAYVFLGDYCGARVEDKNCYVNGKVDYNLVSSSPKFKDGLERIKKGMEKYRIVLMCAEKDPITCHRSILICRNMSGDNIVIKHILSNGMFEEHKYSEQRLMKIFNLNQPNLFLTYKQRLDDAYSRQGKKISYETVENSNDKLEHDECLK